MGKLDSARSNRTPLERRVLSNLRAALQMGSDARHFADAGEAELWEGLRSGNILPTSEADIVRRIRTVEQHILKTVGPTAFTPGSTEPWPTNDSLFRDLADFVGCAPGHIEGIHLGTVSPTLDDVIMIAAYLDTDPAQLLLPTVEELSADAPILASTVTGADPVHAQDFALWILGLAALPFQDWAAYRANTSSAEITTPWKSLRTSRDTASVLRDRETRRAAPWSAWDMLEPLPEDDYNSGWALEAQGSSILPSKKALGLAFGIRLLLRDLLHPSASRTEPEQPTRFERRGRELTHLIRRLWHLLHTPQPGA